MRYSPPSAAAACDYETVTEAQHKLFHAAHVALGEKAVAAAKHKGKTGDLIARYKALSGAARASFFSAHSLALFAALNASR